MRGKSIQAVVSLGILSASLQKAALTGSRNVKTKEYLKIADAFYQWVALPGFISFLFAEYSSIKFSKQKVMFKERVSTVNFND